MTLPDYPQLKGDISKLLLLIMEDDRDQRIGPFNKASRVFYHEGETQDISTTDGEIQEVEMKTLEIEETITLSKLAYMNHEQIVEFASAMGKKFGDLMFRQFMKDLSETLEASGRVVNANGRELNADLLLELLEGIQIEFDIHGQPNRPDLILGSPDHAETIRRLTTEDEDFRARYTALMGHKKEEWLARESNRKLVD